MRAIQPEPVEPFVARPATPVPPGRMRIASHCGPLAAHLMSSTITDIFVNGASGLWVDNGNGLERVEDWTLDEASVRDLAVRLISLGGRHIDEATPCVDVRLPGGVRAHAVLPPVSAGGTLLSIRLPRMRSFTLDDLAQQGMFDGGDVRTRLDAAVAARSNLLITGAGGTGKTTLLGALLASAPAAERIVTIEDVAELNVAHPHAVSLESRQANLEGAGEVGLQRLVREALRMRPDRLVLGECRGPEVRDMLSALNTGHDGGASTLHANSLADVPSRMEALGALADLTPDALARQAVSAIDLIVHLERVEGMRRVHQTGEFALTSGRLTVVTH